MMKKLLITSLLGAFNLLAYSQFTPGNLVVVRLGNGSTTLGASTTNVSLLELNPSGTLINTVNLDASTSGSRLTLVGTGQLEGVLKLSNDKQYLTLGGYDAADGTTGVITTVGASSFTRVIARIGSDAVPDYSTKILKVGAGTTNGDYYGGNFRTVMSNDGTGFYFGNSTQGIRYVPLGNSPTTVPTIITTTNRPTGTTAFTNIKSLGIFGNELYASLTSMADYGLAKIGSGLSTSADQAPTNLTGFPINNASAGDFVFFDLDNTIPGVDVAYTLEATNLRKYIFNGTSWSTSSSVGTRVLSSLTLTSGGSGYTSPPTVTITGVGGSGATATAVLTGDAVTGLVITNSGSGYSTTPTVSFSGGGGSGATATATLVAIVNGMTGILSGGKPVLFYTTGANGGNNFLVRVNDDNGYDPNINATFHSTIASAGANYIFRGVAFTPNTNTLPVDLTSFTGKNTSNGVLLNWETASEQNNLRFDVLRSVDGVQFQTISSVSGKGNSSQINRYSYLDINPSSGVNYYKLNQIDYDGKTTPSKVVPVNTGLKMDEFNIVNYKDDLTFSINAVTTAKATLSVLDINGRKLIEKQVLINPGFNANQLSISELKNGIYIANIIFNGATFTKKIIK